MKKICFITTIPGTLITFFLEAAEYIRTHSDWEITFISNYEADKIEKIPPNIRFIPVTMRRGVNLNCIKTIPQLYHIFKRENFDIVQYSTPNAAFYAAIAAKLAGAKIRVYHLMGFRYFGNKGVARAILKILDWFACKCSTHIECVSKSNLRIGVKERLFPNEKAVVVWNGSTGGVNLSRFDYSQRKQWRQQIRAELGYGDDDFVFGFVGRITRDKGINEILEAFSSCRSEAKLLLVGAEEGLDTLDQTLLQNAHQDPNIQFHDRVSDVERYYAAIDILLLPSYREGFGNVIIEAAAVGTPAIVSDIPGPIDAIERDKTAYVIPPKDVAALTAAMKKSMIRSNGLSSEYCAYFAAEKFDSKKLCEKIYSRKRALIDGDNK